ncbi:MAG: proteasome-associated ATPase [Actinomycetota bacterium]|nr:proteasome-associated ATPase [Actinomycetota bacterium]MEA2488098.1 proteasome-associated ATPase [Actinomycetota bacterium]
MVEVPDGELERRITAYDREVQDLQGQLKLVQDELALTKRKLEAAPRRIHELEKRLAQTAAELADAHSNGDKLASTLREAREQLLALKEQVEKLSQPPASYAVFLEKFDDGTLDVFVNSRKMRVNASPEVDLSTVTRGQEVILNEAMNVVDTCDFEIQGEVVTLKEVMDDGRRALVIGRTDEERVVELAGPILDARLRAGDSLLLEPKSGHVLEKLPKPEVEELVLEEVPDISYEDIGGLAGQLEEIRDAVELPFLHADLFREHELEPPKGVLLYGPPGCGKTLVAKAVANSLAKKVAAKLGRDDRRSYFLNIKGPELLNKYVGETERQIRLIFQRAKEKSEEGVPIIVFFDEMESLFRTRGSGISSDMEATIVPQLLAEIDGVETLKNVIVIGASNREDLIDPAILRPGRLDVKIKIERPDAESACDIFAKYLTPNLPLAKEEVARHGSAEKAVKAIIGVTVEKMYSEDDDNRFLEVTYANGDKETLFFKDFSSGAMIENIVRRAKKLAIKRAIAGKERGVNTDDMLRAIQQEYRENEDLPNTTNPDDWAKISGKKGERIVYIRTLVGEHKEDAGRQVQSVQTGQYL